MLEIAGHPEDKQYRGRKNSNEANQTALLSYWRLELSLQGKMSIRPVRCLKKTSIKNHTSTIQWVSEIKSIDQRKATLGCDVTVDCIATSKRGRNFRAPETANRKLSQAIARTTLPTGLIGPILLPAMYQVSSHIFHPLWTNLTPRDRPLKVSGL